MVFGGIQKLTLLDYPDKTACTLFTVGCNFKCPFCHNAALVSPAADSRFIDEDEVLRFLASRKGLLDGVCISGGEPLMHPELLSFMREVKAMGFSVKLDTNGSFPQRLRECVELRVVDYVAMDIKNAPEKYAVTVGLSTCDLTAVQESVTFLLTGTIPYEFRTTIVRELHTADDLMSVARWLSGATRYYFQGFIDSKDVMRQGLSSYSSAEMRAMLCKVKKVLPAAELRGI